MFLLLEGYRVQKVRDFEPLCKSMQHFFHLTAVKLVYSFSIRPAV